MNVILDDVWRERLAPQIEMMNQVCPEMMSRKFSRANVQQGWMLYMVMANYKKDAYILVVGCHEDTCAETLKALGYENMVCIDPVVNFSLEDYYRDNPFNRFDCVFSTSVIEHVENDELFIDRICKFLYYNGKAFLTCDFREDYKEGDPKPGEDKKLYTTDDITVRLAGIMEANDCKLFGEIDYSADTDFDYGGARYSFATISIIKTK